MGAENLPLPVFDPRTFHHVASRSGYSTSDCATTSTKQSFFHCIIQLPYLGTRDSVVAYAVDWTVWVSVPGREYSLLQNVEACSETLSLIFIVYRGVKRPWPEVDHSPASNAEVKNKWSYTSTSPIAFMV